jgi:glycosyltransferase involved in cell wall biosynthesis
MMKVAFITRSTLNTVPGGDTVQIMQTAHSLSKLGVTVDIKRADETIDYAEYDLLHFSNIIRPADILSHVRKAKKPYLISTILVDYSAYDKHHRKGIGRIFTYLSADTIEYLKTIARWALGRDGLSSPDYLWKGQRSSIIELLKGASMILPNSTSEYERIKARYGYTPDYEIVPNGIDPAMFNHDISTPKDNNLVICVARIEGIKNQLNLIKALNNTHFKLLLIGSYSPNQYDYYKECRDTAAANIEFIDHIPQDQLLKYYSQAKVHVLPSWFETTGLSTIEGAAMGCNIVITDKGDTRCYFEDDAYYCDPASPESILQAIETASTASYDESFGRKIATKYTWQQAAFHTLSAYQSVLAHCAQTALIYNV